MDVYKISIISSFLQIILVNDVQIFAFPLYLLPYKKSEPEGTGHLFERDHVGWRPFPLRVIKINKCCKIGQITKFRLVHKWRSKFFSSARRDPDFFCVFTAKDWESTGQVVNFLMKSPPQSLMVNILTIWHMRKVASIWRWNMAAASWMNLERLYAILSPISSRCVGHKYVP